MKAALHKQKVGKKAKVYVSIIEMVSTSDRNARMQTIVKEFASLCAALTTSRKTSCIREDFHTIVNNTKVDSRAKHYKELNYVRAVSRSNFQPYILLKLLLVYNTYGKYIYI